MKLDRWALARIQRTVRAAPIRFLLWDEFELSPAAGAPIATVLFRNRSALFGWVWDPELISARWIGAGSEGFFSNLRVSR
jgi:hypothetical protein